MVRRDGCRRTVLRCLPLLRSGRGPYSGGTACLFRRSALAVCSRRSYAGISERIARHRLFVRRPAVRRISSSFGLTAAGRPGLAGLFLTALFLALWGLRERRLFPYTTRDGLRIGVYAALTTLLSAWAAGGLRRVLPASPARLGDLLALLIVALLVLIGGAAMPERSVFPGRRSHRLLRPRSGLGVPGGILCPALGTGRRGRRDRPGVLPFRAALWPDRQHPPACALPDRSRHHAADRRRSGGAVGTIVIPPCRFRTRRFFYAGIPGVVKRVP